MPDGVAPAGPGVGEEVSSVSVPPLTEKPLIAFEAVSTTQSVEPSGESRASSAPCAGASDRRVAEQGQRRRSRRSSSSRSSRRRC